MSTLPPAAPAQGKLHMLQCRSGRAEAIGTDCDLQVVEGVTHKIRLRSCGLCEEHQCCSQPGSFGWLDYWDALSVWHPLCMGMGCVVTRTPQTSSCAAAQAIQLKRHS